ncbi:MAG: hypothetical protein QXW74_01820 [Archaeoglobaceae archaeon]
MHLRKLWIVAIYILLIGIGVGASVYFSVKGNVKVFESNVTVYPQYFSIDVAKGMEYVKKLRVNNSGAEVCVYFEDVILGPNPEMVDVKFRDTNGNSIYFRRPICLPEGTAEAPSTTVVYAHIIVNESAPTGNYSIYIFVRD